jgi:hypothetical protein
MKKTGVLGFAVSLLFSTNISASDVYVKGINISGLQRVEKETVLSYIDVEPNESEEDIIARIKEHCDRNGGTESVITCGGDITVQLTDQVPSEEDYNMYECID